MKILVVEDNIKILNSIYDELNNHFDTYKCSDVRRGTISN